MRKGLITLIAIILFIALVYTRIEAIDNFQDAEETIDSCRHLLWKSEIKELMLNPLFNDSKNGYISLDLSKCKEAKLGGYETYMCDL